MGTAMFILMLTCLALSGVLGADPVNTAAWVGEAEVTLQCAYGTTTGRTWSKGSTKLATDDTLENGIEVTKYEVTTSGADYTLKVKTIAIDDGEKYACSDTTNTKSARLVPMAQPTCSLAKEGTDKIKFTCIGGYGGDWPPKATMKANDDSEIGSGPAGTHDAGATTRQEDIQVSEDNDGHEYKCQMVLVIDDNPDKDTADIAQEIPATEADKYKCSITAVKPGGVTITSGGGHTELTESDSLTCVASTAGVPTGTFQWSDPDGGIIGSSDTYTVTAAMVGKTVTCTVSNNIGSPSVTFPASTELSTSPDNTATSTEAPEDTSRESSGRMITAVVGELGLTILIALLF